MRAIIFILIALLFSSPASAEDRSLASLKEVERCLKGMPPEEIIKEMTAQMAENIQAAMAIAYLKSLGEMHQ